MVPQSRKYFLIHFLSTFSKAAPKTVVLPNGEIMKTRSRARKSAAGFDTTKLFIGAEGTLGVVTEGS
jgi:hypothetical protein